MSSRHGTFIRLGCSFVKSNFISKFSEGRSFSTIRSTVAEMFPGYWIGSGLIEPVEIVIRLFESPEIDFYNIFYNWKVFKQNILFKCMLNSQWFTHPDAYSDCVGCQLSDQILFFFHSSTWRQCSWVFPTRKIQNNHQ